VSQAQRAIVTAGTPDTSAHGCLHFVEGSDGCRRKSTVFALQKAARMRAIYLLPVLTVACTATAPEFPTPDDGEQLVVDDAVGVALTLPEAWKVKKDPVLFDTLGFLVTAPTDGHDDAIARISLAYQKTAADLDAMVAEKLDQYAAVNPERRELTLADGRRAVAVTELPGTAPYTAVFTADGDRLYEVGLWSSSDEPFDATGEDVLQRLVFYAPSARVADLDLTDAKDALYALPPDDIAPVNARAAAERSARYLDAVAADPELRAAAHAELAQAPDKDPYSCGFTAPSSLYWQTQWDASNTFYSGSYYDLRANPGWSAMSGNYGSWWGTNYHVGLCYANYANQYYANDWPAQYWANAYAAFTGYVKWAGWGTDGFVTLGRYVVVRNGSYRSLTAHLSGLNSGIYWGAWVDGYNKVIGFAGSTGGDWAPHLHARVSWGESLTWNGQPYGGESVRPRAIRCFDCNDYDVAASGGGGYYTAYYHGRWMRY
jgi:murein DD-endopeptidase MepM/ murein hydrolase activator NlpD